jgi:hypothetical protein
MTLQQLRRAVGDDVFFSILLAAAVSFVIEARRSARNVLSPSQTAKNPRARTGQRNRHLVLACGQWRRRASGQWRAGSV